MSFALQRVPQVIQETLDLAGWAREDVGLFGLHQANKFMVEYLAKASRLPKGTAPVAIHDTGNTGPASIPLMLGYMRDAFPPERRARTVLCGFGAGLSWGACALDLSSANLLSPIEI
jgi:3-oxoacyl-[acyl-carrier-protein] synthase III